MSSKVQLSHLLNPEVLYVFSNEFPQLQNSHVQSKPHTHEMIELSIILDGTAHYQFDDQEMNVPKESLIVLNPNVLHAVTLPVQEHYKDLHIGLNHLLLPTGEFNYFPLLKKLPLFDFKENKSIFFETCHTLLKENTSRKPGYKTMLRLLVTQLVVLIYRELENTPIIETKSTLSFGYPQKRELAEAMIHYMNTHYMQDISLEVFSKDMYLSQVYLSKIFKEEVGTSPINYLIHIRLSHAKELLEKTDLPIRMIAAQVGYTDMYHFSKLFKKYYGFPPSKCRYFSKH
ncbi:hypothetical protein CS063_00975 [Sporanaerobium hydrogeniformans]|uniref:Uncharacterized protein n=1 Tax=Sporanaerobium hydrogeniformans TaxID=3072179 RepID=A0AC61DGS9_9FIRM|nr:AraC family transcriptional regulator [Sporanaerobium hydrogeniformans]PHV72083.1 hypothetical protein CS063_00975 [Sporanaerobium hydrogeniformans]